MANLVYRRTTVTQLKAIGILDSDACTIEINGEDKHLSTLLRDYNGADIELLIKVKNEEDLDTPSDDTSD